jgi:poly(3-hydroxybutyrate) depolymerase
VRESQRHAPITLAPLAGEQLEQVTFDHGVEAWIAKPIGATEPRPVIVGVHGAGDRADWSCTEWAATTGGQAWVVCPRGVPSQWAGFHSWGSAEQIAARAELVLAHVREKYAAYVSNAPLTYGGWSQGATLASSAIASRPGQYGTAILVEAGYTPLDENVVMRDLASGGVTRLVVSCSSIKCRDLSTRLERVRSKRVAMWKNDVGLRGHWFDQPVFDSLGNVLREVDSSLIEPEVLGHHREGS